ncbi:hypothetical protein [Longimicrobium sp.]|uniref:hypothetical protein n=1 Tax=Longimicrobium sp. TaxID=2029185 RepID=UPI003B3B68DC
MRDLLGWLGYLVFAGLGVVGTSIAVAWLCLLVDRVPAASKQLNAGRLGELRRCTTYWAVLSALCVVALAILSRA